MLEDEELEEDSEEEVSVELEDEEELVEVEELSEPTELEERVEESEEEVEEEVEEESEEEVEEEVEEEDEEDEPSLLKSLPHVFLKYVMADSESEHAELKQSTILEPKLEQTSGFWFNVYWSLFFVSLATQANMQAGGESATAIETNTAK